MNTVPRKTIIDAYKCERELVLNLIKIEEIGVRINLKGLKEQVEIQRRPLIEVEKHIKLRLGNPNINLNSSAQVIHALKKQDLIDLDKVTLTPTGLISTSKDALPPCIKDAEFLSLYLYQTQLSYCYNTFMTPWVKMALANENEGVLYTTWHQTAGNSKTSGQAGARTGRLSSSPNFQNIPKKYKPLFRHEASPDYPDRDKLPECPIDNLPPMPIMRSFVIPRYDDHVLIELDYSQQEIRLLAHFENGSLMQAYGRDPKMDVHKLAIKLMHEKLGKLVLRDVIKIIVFSIMYGKGTYNLASELNCTYEEAKALKEAYYKIFPGIRGIQAELEERASKNMPFTTIGGRVMYCEPTKKNKKGQWVDLAYKMINTELQGSAGDVTKMAINNYMRTKPDEHHLLLTVHDSLLCSIPCDEVEQGIKVLKEAMQSVPCDVLLLAEGKDFGATSWDLLK